MCLDPVGEPAQPGSGGRLGTAFAVGCCQILAMIPGVSRAGATIMGALMLARRVTGAAAT